MKNSHFSRQDLSVDYKEKRVDNFQMSIETLYKELFEFEYSLFTRISNSILTDEDGNLGNDTNPCDIYDDFRRSKILMILINPIEYNQLLTQAEKEYLNGEDYFGYHLSAMSNFTMAISYDFDCRIIVSEKIKNLEFRIANVVCKLKRKQSEQVIC